MRSLYIFVFIYFVYGCNSGELANYSENDKIERLYYLDERINNKNTPNVLQWEGGCFIKKDGHWSYSNSTTKPYVKFIGGHVFCYSERDVLWMYQICSFNAKQKAAVEENICKHSAFK